MIAGGGGGGDEEEELELSLEEADGGGWYSHRPTMP